MGYSTVLLNGQGRNAEKMQSDRVGHRDEKPISTGAEFPQDFHRVLWKTFGVDKR